MGSGASGLRHLSTLAISEMKIDRSFVSRMHDDERAQAVIRSLIGLAAGLAIEVTAEGVESAQQLRQLKDLGVDCVQGFYVCPPLSSSTEPLFTSPAGRQTTPNRQTTATSR
jgi:EAL domain-containing protein (putative c-di-GMP-specific phosphodiesterase class I)